MTPTEKVNRLTKNHADKKRTSTTPPIDLVVRAVDAVLSRKAEKVLVMDLRDVTGIADYFVICEGTTDIQIKAIANAAIDQVKEHCSEKPWHSEGMDTLQWVLLDYVDVVVHVMTPEKREYYGLERLWGDASTVEIADELNTDEIKEALSAVA
ncbi:MAG: ribosome silencing factor [Bacteroidetes bacterium]|nr:ribosome silencing factor [Bacteroidota bacterium]